MNLAALDLNLLLVFEGLMLERGVGRAGKRIGLSQPAVSNALGRLRAAFGDPLFVRSGTAMLPTARATQLAAPILAALAQIRDAVGERAAFDPAKSDARFRIETSDYGEVLIVAPLVRRLRTAAPEIALQVRRTKGLFELPADELRAGAIDCAIGFFPAALPPASGLMGAALMDERLVVISAKRRRTLTTQQFAAAPQVRLNVGRERPGLIDEALARRGLQRKIALTLPDFASIPAAVAGTDLLAVMPERLARLAAQRHRLHLHRLPLSVPPLRVMLAWHERNHQHPAHAWLREQIIHAANRRPS